MPGIKRRPQHEALRAAADEAYWRQVFARGHDRQLRASSRALWRWRGCGGDAIEGVDQIRFAGVDWRHQLERRLAIGGGLERERKCRREAAEWRIERHVASHLAGIVH